jgi:hypothetical protein
MCTMDIINTRGCLNMVKCMDVTECYILERDMRSEGPQNRLTVKYGHESRGSRNRESLCWRGPIAICLSNFTKA